MDIVEQTMSIEARIIDKIIEEIIGRPPIAEDYKYITREGDLIFYLHIKLGEIETTVSDGKLRSEFTPIAHLIIEE